MTDTPRCAGPDCGRPSPDAYLCTGCTGQLERILAELPAHLADLEVTLTRQARTTRGGGGKPTKAAEAPLPYDPAASDLAHEIRNGLSTWIRDLCGKRKVPVPDLERTVTMWANTPRGPVAVPAEPIGAMAVWLLEHVESIRQDEAAGDLLTWFRDIERQLRAAVDNRQYRYAGPCTAVLRPLALSVSITDESAGLEGPVLVPTAASGDPGPCGADLKHRVGAPTIVCKDCGAEYDAAERAAWIDKASADSLATGPMIAKALAAAGYQIKAATIRNWAERTRKWATEAIACSVLTKAPLRLVDGALQHERYPIAAAGLSEDGLPLYPVGAVMTRVKADPARHPDRQEIGA